METLTESSKLSEPSGLSEPIEITGEITSAPAAVVDFDALAASLSVAVPTAGALDELVCESLMSVGSEPSGRLLGG